MQPKRKLVNQTETRISKLGERLAEQAPLPANYARTELIFLIHELEHAEMRVSRMERKVGGWRELERFVRMKAADPSLDLDAEITAVLRRLNP